MTAAPTRLFDLLRAALTNGRIDINAFTAVDADGWMEIYHLSSQQGVLALAYDGIKKLPENLQPPKNIRLKWAYNTDRMEKAYEQRKRSAQEFAALMARHGIRTLCLKGLGISRYYPVPAHRPFGDLDCFAMGRYEEVNRIMRAMGVKVAHGNYKHSNFLFKGLEIENHQFCTGIRGEKGNREFERILQRLLASQRQFAHFENSHLLLPPAQFEALHFIRHALSHFLPEGITLRTLCDWHCLLQGCRDEMNFEEFYEICKQNRLKKFADTLTAAAVRVSGLTLTDCRVGQDERYVTRLLDDILYDRQPIFNAGGSLFFKYVKMAGSCFKNRWRYDKIYDVYFLKALLISGWMFLTDRKPNL